MNLLNYVLLKLVRKGLLLIILCRIPALDSIKWASLIQKYCISFNSNIDSALYFLEEIDLMEAFYCMLEYRLHYYFFLPKFETKRKKTLHTSNSFRYSSKEIFEVNNIEIYNQGKKSNLLICSHIGWCNMYKLKSEDFFWRRQKKDYVNKRIVVYVDLYEFYFKSEQQILNNFKKYDKKQVLSVELEEKKTILDLIGRFELEKRDNIVNQHLKTDILQKKQIEVLQKRILWLLIFLIASIFFLILLLIHYCKVVKKNILLLKMKESLENEKKKLLEANNIKDALFTTVSHDLRSPVSSLVSYIKLYQTTDPIFLNISRSLYSLENTLNNLLKWSSSQLRNEAPELIEVFPVLIINDILEGAQKAITTKKIAIIKNYYYTGYVKADESYLQIIIRNIVSNSVKFTAKNGVIRIMVLKENNNIEIRIRDSGKGIPQEKLESIFRYPFSSKGTEGEIGTGLGLTLSKDLAEKIGIEFTIKSQLGIGTEVTLKFPQHD